MKNQRIIIKALRLKILLVTLILPVILLAQSLDDENVLSITLSDGTSVVLYGKYEAFSKEKSLEYYYVPTDLRLGSKPDSTPEFLFAKFTTEERADQGGVSGAIIHFLMEWGLDPKKKAELSQKLTKKIRGAKIMGAIPLQIDDKQDSFRVMSATLSDKDGAKKMITSGKAPLIEGGKVAAATKLDKYEAQLLASTFEKGRSITDLSIVLNYNYIVRAPAAQGQIVINWNKLSSEYDEIAAKYSNSKTKKKCGFFNLRKCTSTTTNYNEARSHYDFLAENKIIDVQWDGGDVEDERTAVFKEAFFQAFLSKFTDTEKAEEPEGGSTMADTLDVPNIHKGHKYTFKTSIYKRSFKSRNDTIRLSTRLPIKKSIQIEGNLGSWYDAVRNNKNCVYSVNLNDPFFQHRDIRFVLDLEAKEMFDEAVNYVTVNVRKKRSTGNDYENHLTIDKSFIEKNGITGVKTYARGADTDPSVYQYQTQWSLKGGNIYPKNPKWKKGAWEGVTLEPPVTTRTIELEADLDELQSSDITRITAQVRYKQFDEEAESNIQLSAQKGEPIISKKIFVDKGTNGYVYRLIINHKKEKKLVLPWEPMVNDNYIYANIPEDLLDTESEVFKIAKKTGEDIVKKASEKVLDKFDKIFKSNK